MSNIERVQGRSVALPSAGTTRGERWLANRTARELAAVEHRMVVRMASIHADGFVEAEKLREIDRLTVTAMNGQAYLRGYGAHLAGDDLGAIDDMRFFTDMAKLGKGEIIATTIDVIRYQ
jgi:hypothetical protein